MRPLVYRVANLVRAAYWRSFAPLTLGVRAAVFDEAGRILLVRHSYRPGWYLPGGGVDKRETVRDAARREAFEEAGVTALDEPVLFGVYSNFAENKSDHVVLFRFGQHSFEPKPNVEIDEVGFFDPAALPADATPGTRRRLDEMAGRAPISPFW